ncbi:MAG: hypothetical protein ACHBN1_12755 [Heteroscytonema crispum UTEX LB 1556]
MTISKKQQIFKLPISEAIRAKHYTKIKVLFSCSQAFTLRVRQFAGTQTVPGTWLT